jgi:uncharacterized protein YjbI with pentapeptide repeats
VIDAGASSINQLYANVSVALINPISLREEGKLTKRKLFWLFLLLVCLAPFASPVFAEEEREGYSAVEILEMIRVGGDVVIRNAVIRGALDFTTLPSESLPDGTKVVHIPGSISIVKSEITDDVTAFSDEPAVKVAFDGPAEFEATKFFGLASFDGAEFSRDASFHGATFSGDAVIFSDAKFSGDANFDRAKFSGHADFPAAEFSGYADFDRAKFSGHADFPAAEFSGEGVIFSDAEFSGDRVIFSDAKFSGDAVFDRAKFSRYASFYRAEFSEEAIFSSTVFDSDADFEGARFEKAVSFPAAQFKGQTDFAAVEFRGIALFLEAQFKARLRSGEGLEFGESVRFDQVTFHDLAVFRKAQFEHATFSGRRAAIFYDAADFRKSQFQTADFSEVVFQDADFTGATVTTTLAITDTIYKNLRMDWQEVAHVIEPRDDPEVFRRLEENFRDLKRLDYANGAYYQRKIVERQSKPPREQYLEMVLVDWICGYGVRPKNVFIVSIVFILLFTFRYLPSNTTISSPPTEERRQLTVRLKELPLASSRQEKEWQETHKEHSHIGRFWRALGFSFTVFTKIGFGDIYGTRRVRRSVILEWFLRLIMIYLLFDTLSNTIPVLHTLLTGVF